MLLGQGVDAKGEEIEQAVIPEGSHGELAHVGLLLQQVVEHPLHQDVGGGDQRLGQLAELLMERLDQAIPFGAREVGPFTQVAGRTVTGNGLFEARFSLLTDRQFRQCSDQGDMTDGRGEQGGGEVQARLLVFTRHGDEVLGGHGTVDGEDLHAPGLLLQVEGIRRGEAACHQERVHMAAHQHPGQLLFGVRIVLRADDEQLISLGAGPLLQALGELGVTGVFEVGQDEAEGAGLAAAQGSGAAVRLIVVGMDHGHHLVAGCLADAVLIGLAIDHIAGGGARDTGQRGDFIQFHHVGSV